MNEISNLIQQKIFNIENGSRKQNRALMPDERRQITSLNNTIKRFKAQDPDTPMTSSDVRFLENLVFDVTGERLSLKNSTQASNKEVGLHEAIGRVKDNLSRTKGVFDGKVNKIRNSTKAARNYLNTRLANLPSASLGDFFINVRNASNPQNSDEKNLALKRLNKVQSAASGANETIPSDGGFLVNPAWSREILMDAFDEGKLARKCRYQPIPAGSNEILINGCDETSRANGSRFGGIQSYWLSEAAEISDSKPKFRQINLKCEKNAVLIYATNDLLKDAPSLEAYIREVAPKEIAFSLDDAIVNGSGAGVPLGVLNASSTITVDKELGQETSTILGDNVWKMVSRTLWLTLGRDQVPIVCEC